jgi:hypothetical protein
MEFATLPNWRNQVWLLKDSLTRKWSKNFALGCPTNDVLVFLDILYPPNFACFGKNGVFQQPQAIALATEEVKRVSRILVVSRATRK